ncbi:MAG: hypothetical protein LBD97_10310 [Bifidobacteriaceae bacterium]|jgi:hypothetical protein|nr:hypothetical protein [Bifidobacteriaceae bacterium]
MKDTAAASADLRRLWLTAVAKAHDFDQATLEVEARMVLVGEDDGDLVSLVRTPPLLFKRPMEQITGHDAVPLTQCFMAHSWEIATQTAALLINARCPAVADAIRDLGGPMTWTRKFLSTATAFTNAHPKGEWISSSRNGDSAARSALAFVARQTEELGLGVLRELESDRDATVRHHAGAAIDGAEIWTCTYCFRESPLSEASCPQCHCLPRWSSVDSRT